MEQRHLHKSTVHAGFVVGKVKSDACVSLFTVRHAVKRLRLAVRVQVARDGQGVGEASALALCFHEALRTCATAGKVCMSEINTLTHISTKHT